VLSLPQLQRDVQQVENELRLARNRRQCYETLGEELLAADARRVVEGHEKLRATLTAQIQAITSSLFV
jgi:hypothetical protein